MKESVIIQKLIQVGQMLERGELEYSGAEIDTKHYLEQYVALRQPLVSVSLLDRAASLVGNPGTNISGSTDMACDEWQKDYERWRNER